MLHFGANHRDFNPSRVSIFTVLLQLHSSQTHENKQLHGVRRELDLPGAGYHVSMEPHEPRGGISLRMSPIHRSFRSES